MPLGLPYRFTCRQGGKFVDAGNCRNPCDGQNPGMSDRAVHTRIKEILLQKGMTQVALAKAWGKAKTYVNRKINENEREDGTVDRFNLAQLFDVARILGVSPWELVEGAQEAEKLTDQERVVLRAYRTMSESRKNALLLELINEGYAVEPQAAALKDARRRSAATGAPK